MVIETKNFLHLDFSTVAKILDNSELDIHSEVEIFNAANIWLNHNIEERSKYAKQLLLKVRLPLLSEPALEYILDNVLSLYKNRDWVNMLKTVLVNKSINSQNNSHNYYTNRYCK